MQGGKKCKFFPVRRYKEGIDKVISPSNSVLDYLTYSHVLIGRGQSLDISTGENEAVLVVLKGETKMLLDKNEHLLVKHDAVYLTKESYLKIEGQKDNTVEGLLFTAPATNQHTNRVIKFKDQERRLSGQDSCLRENYLLLDPETIHADRLILGYCWGMPGGWTGWPPHKHSDTLEELYVFYDIPTPGFAVQYLYEKEEDMKCYKVSSGDAVAIAGGYHPIVAIPGFRMKNVWVMAARRVGSDRNLNVVNVDSKFTI